MDATGDDADEQRALDVLLIALLMLGPFAIIAEVVHSYRVELLTRVNPRHVRMIEESGGLEKLDDMFWNHKLVRLFKAL